MDWKTERPKWLRFGARLPHRVVPCLLPRHNTSNHDIATLVAFPLPVMTIGEQGNYDLEGRDPVDLMDFKVTAEGKTVEPKVEIRATRFGVDVTDVLKRYDIPPTMIASGEGARSALNDRLDDLP